MPNMRLEAITAQFEEEGVGLDRAMMDNWRDLIGDDTATAVVKKARICEFAARFPDRCEDIGRFVSLLTDAERRRMTGPDAVAGSLAAVAEYRESNAEDLRIVADHDNADEEVYEALAGNENTNEAALCLVVGYSNEPATLETIVEHENAEEA